VTSALLAAATRTFASLRHHRNYRLYFAGQIVSLAGTWMQNVALAWYVVELTSSPLAVGFLAFCRFVPFTAFGLFAGVVADRLDNRRFLLGTQTFAMCVSIALAALALSGVESVAAAYALAFAGGVALVFDAPSRHALTFQLVGRNELPNAVALNSALFNASRITGPAIAGVIIAAAGVGVCFAINALTFLAVLASLLLMRVDELHALERSGRPGWLRGMREGLAYAWRTPQVRVVLLMVAAISTVGFNFHVILPLLASETLHTGPEVFGLLSACFGGGALVGALLTAALGRASWKALLTGTGGFSVTMLVLAPLESVPAAALLLFATGVCFTLWAANSNSILQLAAPDHLRGRVVSLFLFAFAGLAPIGGVLAGWLVDVGGTQLAFLVAGTATSLVTVVAFAQRPFARPAAASVVPPDPELAA
jgi:MFS family permease